VVVAVALVSVFVRSDHYLALVTAMPWTSSGR